MKFDKLSLQLAEMEVSSFEEAKLRSNGPPTKRNQKLVYSMATDELDILKQAKQNSEPKNIEASLMMPVSSFFNPAIDAIPPCSVAFSAVEPQQVKDPS